jgi:diacylglycerol kinase family enzyme
VVAHGGRLGHRRHELSRAVARAFGDRLAGVAFTTGPGEAAGLAARAADQGADAVIAAGGDGTAFEVLHAIRGRPVALGILPSGSGNDFAFHLGLTGSLDTLADGLGRARIVLQDRLDVNGLTLATAALFGVAAQVGREADRIRSKVKSWHAVPAPLRGAVYQVAAVTRVLKDLDEAFGLTITAEGLHERMRAWSAIVGDSRRIGGAFLAFPDASKRDGVANFVALEKGPFMERSLTSALFRFGLHGRRPGVHLHTFAHAVLETDRPLPWVADGESQEPASRFEVDIVPEGLPLLLP